MVAWTPYALTAFVNAFGDPNSVPMFFQCFTPIFAKTQATLDPILYVGTNKRFRSKSYFNCTDPYSYGVLRIRHPLLLTVQLYIGLLVTLLMVSFGVNFFIYNLREAFFEMLPCQCMADEDDDDDEPKKGGGNKVKHTSQ